MKVKDVTAQFHIPKPFKSKENALGRFDADLWRGYNIDSLRVGSLGVAPSSFRVVSRYSAGMKKPPQCHCGGRLTCAWRAI